MIEVKNDKEVFITIDGQKLYGLYDLLIWLYNADENNFLYHQKGGHFYNWIYNSLEEKDVAEEIKNINSREEMIEIIERYLRGYELYVKKKYKKEEAEIEFIKRFEL
ncbi:MAG: hypothetical protein ACP5GJ_00855 [Nanopusillaceae archaeon]|jgi:hypothetical protein